MALALHGKFGCTCTGEMEMIDGADGPPGHAWARQAAVSLTSASPVLGRGVPVCVRETVPIRRAAACHDADEGCISGGKEKQKGAERVGGGL